MNYFYIIREREFIKTNENIYKIGKTTQELHKRMSAYPKDSESILSLKVPDCHEFEKIMIKTFKENFVQRTDIGTEYFEGDPNRMIDIAYSEYRRVNGEPVQEYEQYEQEKLGIIKMNKMLISSKLHSRKKLFKK